LLRVIIDKDGGVNIDDCEALSRPLDKLLDQEDPIEQSYCLEVSSAGLERELTKDWHFDFSIGKILEVKLIRPIDGKREFIGELKSYCNKNITLMVDNQDININFDDTAYVRWYFEI
ncbi:MAG: ribosome maturation factor RimP, partial [Oscillospiraceae bacterium]